ncbi:transmembrane protein 42 [Anopheles ziemanni]|uniref:transmembrane protein 42 n=1 Tax=Anopheles ziemanni TaxID=345580 RepID=UPI00265E0A0B|nr:transmembrane protein 42 [Anopheles ziemanni]
MDGQKPYYAMVAGICASSASLFGKLTSNSDVVAARIGLPEWPALTQLLCIGIMIALNACVWRFFVKALHTGSGSTLVASLVSAVTNYITSAVLGWLIFKENTTVFWWAGTALVLSGLLLIISGTEEQESSMPSTKLNEKTD